MKAAASVSVLLVVLLARPTSPLFLDSLPLPPWSSNWGARPAFEPVRSDGGGLPVPVATSAFGPFGPSEPSSRSASPPRDSSGGGSSGGGGGGAQPFSQSSFSQSHASFPQSSSFAPSSSSFPQSSSSFPQSSSSFLQSSSSFPLSSSPFSQSSSPFPQSSSSFPPRSPTHSFSPSPPPFGTPSPFSPPHSPSFSPHSSSFPAAQSSFSPSSHAGSSRFEPNLKTPSHSTQQYQECPYDTVCVDEYLCPPYGRSAGEGGRARPRTFNAFNQPLNEIQPELDTSHSHGSSSHDSTLHGGSCGYNRVCCKRQFVRHHEPPHLHHPGPYPPPHGAHLTYSGHGPHGGHLHSGHLSYGTRPDYTAYPSHTQSHSEYGNSGYYPSPPQIYGGGYPQYPAYPTPYYPSYPPITPYLPNPSPYYPPISSYPQQHYPITPGGYDVTPFFGGPQGSPDLGEADGQGTQTPKADGGQRTAPNAARTSRMFP